MLLLFSIFLPNLYACALCSLHDPSARVYLTPKIEDSGFETLLVEIEFSELFTSQMTMEYDKNQNSTLDALEIEALEQDIFSLLDEEGYFLELSIDSEEFKSINRDMVLFRSQEIRDKSLIVSYSLKIGAPLLSEYLLRTIFKDSQNYFVFLVSQEGSLVQSSLDYCFLDDSNFYNHTTFLKIGSCDKKSATLVDDKGLNNQPLNSLENPQNSSILLYLSKKLYSYLELIKRELNELNSGFSLLAWASLLFFSLLYGVVHALGPGHGKMLVGSYSVASKKSFTDVWILSLYIGVTHLFSAFILSVIAIFIINVGAYEFANHSEKFVTSIAGVIIFLVALYLLYKKVTKEPHISSCSCTHCSSKNSDLAVIISSGAIPCPGTVLIFIAVFSIGSYFAGFMSAIFMSLGMSLVIGGVATFGTLLRSSVEKNLAYILKPLEIVALLLMAFMGVLMMLFIFI